MDSQKKSWIIHKNIEKWPKHGWTTRRYGQEMCRWKSQVSSVSLVQQILEPQKLFLATVVIKGGGFIQEVKARRNVELLSLTEENREGMARELVWQIGKALARRSVCPDWR